MEPPNNPPTSPRRLQVLNPSDPHIFIKPIKRINEGHDVPRFLISQGYADIMTFVMQLNRAMCPRKPTDTTGTKTKKPTSWILGSKDVRVSPAVERLREMLKRIDGIIDEVPPDTGPRRFGNISFRKWHEVLEERVSGIVDEFIEGRVLGGEGGVRGKDELLSYLLGAFGSAQRLDYGTGHELSFMAFLGCMWKLGGFVDAELVDDELERSIVLNVIEPYLQVIRRLILTYTLEPAGSHGVWGLDDHSFMPYIFGSAQYCPAISEDESMPVQGSLPGSPSPGNVAKKEFVEDYRHINMYFSAVGFINDVKTGPFWEHSPILFDISGVQKGWGKINKGMLKMFDAEVLGKFPVVQHFPFGSLFSWDQDPNAMVLPTTIHTSNQPSSRTISVTGNDMGAPTSRPVQSSMKAPWATTNASPRPGPESMKAPWASTTISARPAQEGTKAPWASGNLPSRSTQGVTRAPWATNIAAPNLEAKMPTSSPFPPTTAPWAKPGSSSAESSQAP